MELEPKINPNFEEKPGNLDSFIAELNQKKQAFDEPTAQTADFFPGDTTSGESRPEPDENEAPKYSYFDEENEHETESIDPERAKRDGQRFALLADKGVSIIASKIGGNKPAEYRAEPDDIKDFGDALGELVEEYDLKLSPQFQAVLVGGMTFYPVLNKAFSDRRINKLQDEVKQIKDEIEKQRDELAVIRAENKEREGGEPPTTKKEIRQQQKKEDVNAKPAE